MLINFSVKLNGGRRISGILRGFDPFMNLVVDETIEETKTGEKHAIGMVVRSFDNQDTINGHPEFPVTTCYPDQV